MKQAVQAEAFEEVLFSYAEMCYSVALALTRNPHRAQDLASYALTCAWSLRDTADSEKDIKRKLLKVLRERFLQYYCQVPCSLRDEEVPLATTTGVGLRGRRTARQARLTTSGTGFMTQATATKKD